MKILISTVEYLDLICHFDSYTFILMKFCVLCFLTKSINRQGVVKSVLESMKFEKIEDRYN